MAATAISQKPAIAPAEVVTRILGYEETQKSQGEQLGTLNTSVVELTKGIEALQAKANGQAQYNVAGVVGGFPRDSGEYSVIRAARYCTGRDDGEKSKYEIDVSNKLWTIYKSAYGFNWADVPAARRMLIPFATDYIPRENAEAERMVVELKQKMVANADRVDPDEVNWVRKRMGLPLITKDLGTISDAQGGVLVGFPTLGELIDLQRNEEVFARAGAREIALPPNGRIQYPKLTNATTAFWIGEGAAITESTPSTGYLDLQAKKLGIFVDLNNELIRFGSVAAEAMVRGDMAKVAALKMDLAQLEGTGGTQIKGLITYPSASSWSTGTDPLLAFTVTSNLIQISDAADMEAKLPDTAGDPTAWVMRRDMWAKIRNRRSDSVTVTDAKGQYLTSQMRDTADRIPLMWDGTKVIRSSQVSNTRGSGSQTYVILGYFPDWITGRFGALEFLSSMVGDTQMTNDQTRIRCIQHVDAGPRHASSFIFADSITIS